MDEKLTPGAPPPTNPKPKPSNPDRPSFGFYELLHSLMASDFIEGERWYVFGLYDYIVKIKEFDFYSYINAFFFEEEQMVVENKEFEDVCEPDFEEDIQPTEVKRVDINTKEEKILKVFKCYNLPKNIKINIIKEN